jgi:ribosomal-protein-alanine N-acetyltransferase
VTTRIPALTTERLIIRELAMDDLEALHRILNEAFGRDTPLELRERWLQWTVLGYEMFEMLEQPHYGERGITLKSTGELIGAVGIVPYIDSFGPIAALNGRPDGMATAEVGLFWAIAPAHQRQGYASEAAGEIVNFLFERLRLSRIIATTGRNNLASQAVMRNIGMTIERIEIPHPPGIYVLGVLRNRSAEDRTRRGSTGVDSDER